MNIVVHDMEGFCKNLATSNGGLVFTLVSYFVIYFLPKASFASPFLWATKLFTSRFAFPHSAVSIRLFVACSDSKIIYFSQTSKFIVWWHNCCAKHHYDIGHTIWHRPSSWPPQKGIHGTRVIFFVIF